MAITLIGGSTAIWLGPLKQRHLVRNGIPVRATVIAKLSDKDSRGNYRYWVWYSYVAPAKQNAPHEKQQRISHEEFIWVTEGDCLTVMCDARDAGKSIIYKFCKYRALNP